MQNVQFPDTLPRIGVGVSAPGAQLAQVSLTEVFQLCLTHVTQTGLKVGRTQSPPLELRSPPARTLHRRESLSTREGGFFNSRRGFSTQRLSAFADSTIVMSLSQPAKAGFTIPDADFSPSFSA